MYFFFFFFFKQKTAYEMLRSLVGSEMCIRDRYQRRVHGDNIKQMCGILAIFGSRLSEKELRRLITKLSRRQRQRGPDRSGLFVGTNQKDGTTFALAFERLAIVDTSDAGRQPLQSDDGNVIYLANGEIYNHQEIRQRYANKHQFQGGSDSEAVGIVYDEQGVEGFNNLIGMFGTVIFDRRTNTFVAARDHVGIIPLYTGVGVNGEKFFSSELKGIWDQCVKIDTLQPGHYIQDDWVQRPWYQPLWHNLEYVPTRQVEPLEIRERLTRAVKSHLIGDVPFGVIISGGVDSSVIAAIAMRLVRSGEVNLKTHHMEPEVHSFCIGLENSPDLLAARKVADFIGTKHHEIVFTPDEGIDSIDEVVYYTETFNQTTIRASTPLFLMTRIIKSLGIKILLSGEGADEIFGGYLYFHKAPNEEEFQKETVRKVRDLHKYDLLRGNKATQAWGVELRPPFLDREFLDFSMDIDPRQKMTQNNPRKIEKYILREAFYDPENPYIPEEILWRQKEQFSDGVGYGWVDSLKELTNDKVTDEMWENRETTYPVSTPFSKEMYYYRSIFESHFGNEQCVRTVPYNRSVACSTEYALAWDESFQKNTDESGRAVLGLSLIHI
eukprot:TRINITY_DN738_c0_g1_i6.p1 TRINITY_DN738_c0_g1~~TRINITY_DN738_c0_g1_i6.p1  ORF type:complete len:609 (+),score=184.29 TRINITY_DN738_c0_g1_i6:3-1829(+)